MPTPPRVPEPKAHFWKSLVWKLDESEQSLH
jgi:hypothetical protein